MVQDAVGNDQTLQLATIKMIMNAKDPAEALYWAKKFNVPREKWPWALIYEEEQNECESNNNSSLILHVVSIIYKISLCRYK